MVRVPEPPLTEHRVIPARVDGHSLAADGAPLSYVVDEMVLEVPGAAVARTRNMTTIRAP